MIGKFTPFHIMAHQVTGTGLLSLVADVGGDNKARLVRMAGYIRPDGKLSYSGFYEALIHAKNVQEAQRLRDAGVITDNDSQDDDLTPDERILWNHACNRLNVDDNELESIWEDLSACVSTPDEFDEAYQGSYDGWHPDEEFAQEFFDSIGEMSESHSLYSYIDWRQVWDSMLRYDYDKLETRYSSHYFRFN
jgi:hypothetical protein